MSDIKLEDEIDKLNGCINIHTNRWIYNTVLEYNCLITHDQLDKTTYKNDEYDLIKEWNSLDFIKKFDFDDDEKIAPNVKSLIYEIKQQNPDKAHNDSYVNCLLNIINFIEYPIRKRENIEMRNEFHSLKFICSKYDYFIKSVKNDNIAFIITDTTNRKSSMNNNWHENVVVGDMFNVMLYKNVQYIYLMKVNFNKIIFYYAEYRKDSMNARIKKSERIYPFKVYRLNCANKRFLFDINEFNDRQIIINQLLCIKNAMIKGI